MNCPICNRETDSLLCPGCGFDRSRDYEVFPTFAPLSGSRDARSRLRDGMLRCADCGCGEFRLLFSQGSLSCRRCGHLLTSLELEPVLRALNCTPAPEPVPAPEPPAKPEAPINPFDFEVYDPSKYVYDPPRPPRRIIDIAAGAEHTVALYDDGTVQAIGRNDTGACNLSHWRDISAIAAGNGYTLGLRSDGTVVAAGSGYFTPREVKHWRDIAAIAGGVNIYGLKRDGTVLGGPYDWKNIIAIAAGKHHLVGLKPDSTVVASRIGSEDQGQCDVGYWRKITAIAAGQHHTVGLKVNGTVVTTGSNYHGACSTNHWRGITAIAAGDHHTVGLQRDGTVVATGWNLHGQCDLDSWRGITRICAGGNLTVGLKPDGTLVAAGENIYGQRNVSKLLP